jgi:ubiquinone/menaquinone biosynthesis C-methylase UbiE
MSWAKSLSERYSADAMVYRDRWAPLLLPHGLSLIDGLPLSAAARVLDVGAGCGSLAPHIRQRAPSALVVAIDIAPGMLALVRRDAARAAMDAAHLGLARSSVDVAVLAFMLFHTADPLAALREARRVLRDGGCVGTATWEGDPDFPAQRAWVEELDRHAASGEQAPVMSNHEPVSSEEKVRGLLENAGFGSCRTSVREFGHTFGLEEFLEIRTRMGWSRRRFDSMEPERRQRFLEDARRRLERMTPADLTDRTRVILATAVAS